MGDIVAIRFVPDNDTKIRKNVLRCTLYGIYFHVFNIVLTQNDKKCGYR